MDVALRFIDWYATKGDAYEYNAAALERHMNALAVGNRPRAADSAMAVSGTPLAVPLAQSGGGRGGARASDAAPLRVAWDASADTRAAYLPVDPGAPLSVRPSAGPPQPVQARGGAAWGHDEGGDSEHLPLTGSAGVRIGGTVAAAATAALPRSQA